MYLWGKERSLGIYYSAISLWVGILGIPHVESLLLVCDDCLVSILPSIHAIPVTMFLKIIDTRVISDASATRLDDTTLKNSILRGRICAISNHEMTLFK